MKYLNKRVMAALLVVIYCWSTNVFASDDTKKSKVLFTNVKIFDGYKLMSGTYNVMVKGNEIKRISTEVQDQTGASVVIDGGGRTLMPGLIDAHTHLAFTTISQPGLMTSDPAYPMLRAGEDARDMLMRGFTSVRDAGGPVFGLKRMIDEGRLVGPRIWPSGALISQTSGHGDFRQLYDLPRRDGQLHPTEQLGYTAIADGRAEVLRRVREQLMRGASQIKLTAGGGVTSDHDPLDVVQFTDDELKAAVEAAADWGTYVMVHAYTKKAVRKAIRAGVRSIEHGQLSDEETIMMMKKNDVWLSIQPFRDGTEDPRNEPGSQKAIDQEKVAKGTKKTIKLALKHEIKLAWGVDALFNPVKAKKQTKELVAMNKWIDNPAKVLELATSANGRLLNMSGKRNPYPGELGVVKEGALADLLLVNGDPTTKKGLKLIKDPKLNFVVIMKDGVIYKNTLP